MDIVTDATDSAGCDRTHCAPVWDPAAVTRIGRLIDEVGRLVAETSASISLLTCEVDMCRIRIGATQIQSEGAYSVEARAGEWESLQRVRSSIEERRARLAATSRVLNGAIRLLS